MRKSVLDKLIQKFINKKTDRDEEKTLLNICLLELNNIAIKFKQIQMTKEDMKIQIKGEK